jgi:hypothetical protein
MALTGMCVFAISHRWPILGKLSKWLPVVMLALLLVVPGHFRANPEGRPLLTLYERLAPFGAVFGRPDSVFLVSAYPLEIHGYVGHNAFTSALVNFDYSILAGTSLDRPLPSLLEREGITVFYIDEALWHRLWANPVHRQFLASPESAGWTTVARERTEHAGWALLKRVPRSRRGYVQ